jgi:hypothetical protein
VSGTTAEIVVGISSQSSARATAANARNITAKDTPAATPSRQELADRQAIPPRFQSGRWEVRRREAWTGPEPGSRRSSLEGAIAPPGGTPNREIQEGMARNPAVQWAMDPHAAVPRPLLGRHPRMRAVRLSPDSNAGLNFDSPPRVVGLASPGLASGAAVCAPERGRRKTRWGAISSRSRISPVRGCSSRLAGIPPPQSGSVILLARRSEVSPIFPCGPRRAVAHADRDPSDQRTSCAPMS